MATISNKVILFEEDIPPMTLRPGDADEVRALALTPEEALRLCWAKSNVCFAVYFHNHLGAMWGLRRTGPVAEIWLLTTDAVDAHPVAFVGESRRLMSALLAQFTLLRCEVHCEYARARAWLSRLGFTQTSDMNHLGFVTMERRR